MYCTSYTGFIPSYSRNMRIFFRFITVVLALSIVAGCARSPRIGQLSATETVSLDKAFATPPPGGPAMVGIVETAFTNGRQQDIALWTQGETPGQNLLRVGIVGLVHNDIPNGSDLSETVPSNATIAQEMAQLLPNVRVARSPYFLQNHYGPFSYAAGRSAAGDTCIYAWQHIGRVQSRRTIFSPRGAIQIRLRLCDPVAGEQDLVEKMYGISINAAVLDARWNPYELAGPPPAAWGRSGSPIAPVSTKGFEGVLAPQERPVRSVPKPARVAEEAPKPIAAAAHQPKILAPDAGIVPAASGIIVPLPPADALDSGPRTSVSASK